MKQEEEQLLLRDLCARLPYGVKISTPELWTSEKKIEVLNEIFKGDDGLYRVNDSGMLIEYIKPYLRPMSNMTEEECDMVEEILGDKCIFDFMCNGDIILKQGQFSQNKLAKLYDYYNSIHVDYHNLIPKGLAIDAANLNIY